MRDLNSHSDDFNFAQDCVDGKGSSLSCFHQTYHPTLVAFLKARGATVHEAEETAETVLSECMATTKNGRPKLASYQGACSLQTWLNTVAIHSLYDLRRRKTILAPFDNGMPPEGRIDGGPPGDTVDAELDRVPLLALLRSAIDTAFRECDPEDFVLLQLAHCDQLKERELAVMFRCNTGTICRRLQRARESISEVALRRVKETDEHLELRWDDFLDICRFTDQSYFEES